LPETAQKKVIWGPAVGSRGSGRGGPVSPDVPPRKDRRGCTEALQGRGQMDCPGLAGCLSSAEEDEGPAMIEC
jgi:hypothetical protein